MRRSASRPASSTARPTAWGSIASPWTRSRTGCCAPTGRSSPACRRPSRRATRAPHWGRARSIRASTSPSTAARAPARRWPSTRRRGWTRNWTRPRRRSSTRKACAWKTGRQCSPRSSTSTPTTSAAPRVPEPGRCAIWRPPPCARGCRPAPRATPPTTGRSTEPEAMPYEPIPETSAEEAVHAEPLRARLWRRFAEQPDLPALHTEGPEGGRWLTYGELARAVYRTAHALAALGATPGWRVAVSLPNGGAFVRAWLALAALNVTMMPVNVNLVGAGLRDILAGAVRDLLLVDAALAGNVAAACGGEAARRVVEVAALTSEGELALTRFAP